MTFWEVLRLADVKRRRESTERAALYCLIWNCHIKRRGDRRRVLDFDAIAKAESAEQARQWRKEHAAEVGTIADFINKNQRGRKDR